MLNMLNSQKRLSLSAIFITGLLLQGCSSKVDCNGNKVKENAVEIIQSHLNDAVWYKEIHAALSGAPELTSVKTLSRNDELKQGQCSAKYTFTYNGKSREVDVTYDLAYLQDKGETEVKVAVADVKNGLMGIVMKEPPIKNGVEQVFDAKTGNLQYKLVWKNGVQDGVAETYNPVNNKLIAQVNVVNGQKDGAEKVWSNDGSVLLVDFKWVGGKATGFQKSFDVTGQKLITDLVWKDGKATGFQTVVAMNNGDMQNGYDEYHLKDGLYEGVHKQYWPKKYDSAHDIYLHIEENYKEGKLDGLTQEFDESGKVVSATNYKNNVNQEKLEADAATISCKNGLSNSDALASVRFKTYGLKKLDTDKVNALQNLEDNIKKQLTFSDGNTANFNGRVEDVLIASGPSFGIAGVNNADGDNWQSWFNGRFLPIYLNYVNAVCSVANKQIKKTPTLSLGRQEQFEIAKAIYTSKGNYNGGDVSVWRVPSTPWIGYVLNSDSISVESNISALKK